MTQRTAIEWTDYSSNPIKAVNVETGKRGWFCEKVSPGCANCYAAALNKRFGNGLDFAPSSVELVEWVLDEAELERLLKLPAETDGHQTRVFMCDMTDMFHEAVPSDWIDHIFAVMALRPDVTFQVLTKRPERMREYVKNRLIDTYEPNAVSRKVYDMYAMAPDRHGAAYAEYMDRDVHSVLPNVWVGVSAENQRWLDHRVPVLLDTPAAVRFVSCEPLLGPLDLRRWLVAKNVGGPGEPTTYGLDWVIVGGESGPGRAARKLVERCECSRDSRLVMVHRNNPSPCSGTGWRPKPLAEHWVRLIRDQCVDAGVPFLFKQWGGPTPKAGGRLLDGRTWDETPRHGGQAAVQRLDAGARS